MIHFITDIPQTWCILLVVLIPLIGSFLIGPRMIAILRAMKAGQPIREARKCVNAPDHQAKAGTPTMGGLMIIGLIMISLLLFADLTDLRTQCVLLVMSVTAILGFMDDYAKITKKSTDGVSGWFKIALQTVAALACGIYLYKAGLTHVFVPFYGAVDFGWVFIPFALLVIIGTSNAVNLTDGLDGLASGCTMITSLLYVAICFVACALTGGDLYLIPMTVIAACAGFLWFNCYPAKVFMGDTGSLSLGGILGTLSVCTGTEFILLLAGGVFVAEAVSVMIQVGWFKYTRRKYGEGRRFFRLAPIHHHFEKGGWSETQVCVRFWIVAIILAFFGMLLYADCVTREVATHLVG